MFTIIISASVLALSGVAGYLERKRLVGLISESKDELFQYKLEAEATIDKARDAFEKAKAEAEVELSKAKAEAEADLAIAKQAISAPANIKAAVCSILNDIRADESLLTTHPYQVVSRVRTELLKVL